MGSPAIGKAVAAGSAGTFSLTPVFEYVQPLGSVARAADQDLGAFEYGTVVTPGEDGGAVSPDGGNEGGASSSSGGGSGSSGSSGSGGDGGVSGAPSSSGSHSGCGCLTAGGDGSSELSGLGVVTALGLLMSRRRRNA
jgi:MYXO-CTERM domain-containing protein